MRKDTTPKDALDLVTGSEVTAADALELVTELVPMIRDKWAARVEKDPSRMSEAIKDVARIKRAQRALRYLVDRSVEIRAGLHYVDAFKSHPNVKAVMDGLLQPCENFPGGIGASVSKISGEPIDEDEDKTER